MLIPTLPLNRAVAMRVASTATLLATIAAALPAQQLPPVHQLSPILARTTDAFKSVNSVRQLADGRVLVDDTRLRRVAIYDSTLVRTGLLADSTPGSAPVSYTHQFASLLRYRGDSILFVDQISLTMLVITPNGAPARTIAVPRPEDARTLTAPNGVGGAIGFDRNGKMVCVTNPFMGAPGARSAGGLSAGGPPPTAAPDVPRPTHTAILRTDLLTHGYDTAAAIAIDREQAYNPYPTIDDWAVLTDGTLAVVRGHDFHVDLIDENDRMVSGPKIPFSWEHLGDDDKVRLIDSIKPSIGPMVVNAGDDGADVGTRARIAMDLGLPGGRPTIIEPNQLPDYRAPFMGKAVFADDDDHLWIRTTAAVETPGSQVYDVVDNKGMLIDRVQLPPSRSLVGFGKGGVVYMTVRETAGLLLERARRR